MTTPAPDYESVYQKRTGSHKDGCAIFYLTTRLSLLEWSGVEYQRQVKVLNRDNIGLIGKFEVNRQQPEKRGRNSSRCASTYGHSSADMLDRLVTWKKWTPFVSHRSHISLHVLAWRDNIYRTGSE